MHLILVTSLDGLSRNSAAFALAEESPGTPVVLHDLLDGGVVVRRVHAGDRLIERESMVLEHGCLSCTVRFDLTPTLLRLAAEGTPRAIVGLPPGTTAENAIDGLHTAAPQAFTVDTAALAVRPEDVEDQLWDHHTLFGSGYTAVPEDSRTPGEFLIGEFLFADTVLPTTSELLPDDPALRDRGLQLIGELAPHATVAHLADAADASGPGGGTLKTLGVHDGPAARARSLPGTVLTPAASSESFRTLEHRVTRPLHPDRFRTALGAISEGCCFVRGNVWLAGVDARIAVHGVGPRVSLGNGGPWSAGTRHGEWCRGTHLALTGDDLDEEDIVNLLDACALTDEELHSAPASPLSRSTRGTMYDNTEGAP
ncbi:GTP-binding protein [Arthrobacter zhaoguopingii]|uniref:GTP-binding protein n=1 Tax=Arthrobacter zhaoguopingii TaxID=2681491 RepID=UPI001356F6DB|nr:GTP-binding protein [Arthrobacter zhaoguopingii]